MARPSLFALGLGALTWTAAEYALHRFIGHGPRRRRQPGLLRRLSPAGLLAEFNEEHLAHHADPTYFAPTAQKVLAAVVVTGGLGAGLSPLLGARRAWSYAAGFGAMYAAYELLHRRVHTHPPTHRYGRWRRRHHLLHHYRAPRMNHGVTSPAWDHLLRTAVPAPERLRVPVKQCPAWMVEPGTTTVREALRPDYEVA